MTDKYPLFTQVETAYMDKLHLIKVNADIIGNERVKRIAEAYLNATTKHPKFADEFTFVNPEVIQQQLKLCREKNDNAVISDALTILNEEMLEAVEAYVLGKKDDCISELYQVIAVSLRMIHFVERELK